MCDNPEEIAKLDEKAEEFFSMADKNNNGLISCVESLEWGKLWDEENDRKFGGTYKVSAMSHIEHWKAMNTLDSTTVGFSRRDMNNYMIKGKTNEKIHII